MVELLRPWRSMPQACAAEAVSEAKPDPLAITAMRLPRGRRLVAKPETAAVNSSKDGTSVAPARSTSAARAPLAACVCAHLETGDSVGGVARTAARF